jgi:hypothetical protein
MNKKILNVITHMQTELESEREEREGGREDKREGEREGGREMMMGTDEIGNSEESEESRVLIGLRWLNNHNILDIISSSNWPVHINNLPVSTERQTSNNLHGGQGEYIQDMLLWEDMPGGVTLCRDGGGVGGEGG